jgi:hypothetical protein
MSKRVQLIPGEVLREIFEHVGRTGEPLLRGLGPADMYRISAWTWRAPTGEIDLTLDDGEPDEADPDAYDDEMANVETWGQMADYLDMSAEELVAELEKRGYPWLPDLDNLETGDLDDEPLFEAHDVREYMSHRAPGAHISELLADAPTEFRWDPSTPHPGVPPIDEDTEERAGGSGEISGVAVTDERRGGSTDKVYWVPSAISLSCLQYALDTMNKHVAIQLRR